MTLAVIQMVSQSDVLANLAQARRLLEEAAHGGAQLAVLPENYAAMGRRDIADIGRAEALGEGPILPWLKQAARDLNLWIVAGTLPLPPEGHPQAKVNACSLLINAEGECAARYDKLHVEKHPAAAPIVKIEPQAVTVVKSERVEKERQASLFQDLNGNPQLPTLSLLDEAPEVQETVAVETLEFTSRLIEKKLSDFGVEAKVVAAYPGPVVTRYEIEPATGVKGSQIVGLARDLARSLSLTSIRVVETIPGKNFMALELPNAKRQIVRLSEIVGSKVYNDNPSPLTVALGKDIAGKAVVADLAKMPHLLVAGTKIGRASCRERV